MVFLGLAFCIYLFGLEHIDLYMLIIYDRK